MPRWLIDSNVFVRVLHRGDPQYRFARGAVVELWRRGDSLCLTLQGLTEFWSVGTRPATSRGGFGLTLEEADRRLRVLEPHWTFLPDTEQVAIEWRRLLMLHRVTGVQAHDARLVAAMLAHGATHLLTFNGADFRRYPQITVVHPQEVVDGSA